MTPRASAHRWLALMPALAVSAMLTQGCKRTQLDSPPMTRLEIRLPSPRTGRPPPEDGIQGERVVSVQIIVPQGPWLDGAALRLPTLIGTAEVRLDNVVIARLQSGPGAPELPLGGILSAGLHRFDIDARPDPSQDPILRGASGLRTPPITQAPVLVLRPAIHITTLAATLKNGQVTARAGTKDAPQGALVHFVITLDGKVLADLGTQPVVDGLATTSARPWRGAQWRLGAPSLVNLHAILQAPDGTVIDWDEERVGLREIGLAKGRFVIGGEPVQLVADRADTDMAPPALVKRTLQSGSSTVEFHGIPATDDALNALDEVGMGAVITPRCTGVLRGAVPHNQIGTRIAAVRDELAIQDRDLVAELSPHPSVLLWVVEATSQPILVNLLSSAAKQDRPVVGADIRLSNVMIGAPSHHDPMANAWINETAWNGPRGDAATIASAFTAALGEGALGGVIEKNNTPDRINSWRHTLAAAGVTPINPKGQRATTTLQLSQARPGTVTWLQAPWLVSEAAIVDDAGNAWLHAWYDGPANLKADGQDMVVQLHAGAWTRDGQPPPATLVTVGPGKP
ncbi:MAG: hypothetical protein GXP62_04905 [Oligoflexia bacterium]|nr:hypothetical protein [Oligoflexia bacterium]